MRNKAHLEHVEYIDNETECSSIPSTRSQNTSRWSSNEDVCDWILDKSNFNFLFIF